MNILLFCGSRRSNHGDFGNRGKRKIKPKFTGIISKKIGGTSLKEIPLFGLGEVEALMLT